MDINLKDLENLKTESLNSKSLNLDLLNVHEIVELMNDEDLNCVSAVQNAIPQITEAIECIVDKIKNGGKLIYVGAGTSGRIGILDAVECKPTFSVDDKVVACIAGGNTALIDAVEGAEDSTLSAEQDLKEMGISDKDVLCAITASGRTPYCMGAVLFAKKNGIKTISIACNVGSKISKISDIPIEVNSGPEILTGSTRLKAGTCQKMICNMLSTITMIRLGKVYGNLMVDLKVTNKKLEERAKKIVMLSTECSYEQAQKVLMQSNFLVKEAIVMILLKCTYMEAKTLVDKQNGFIRNCL